MAGQVLEVRGYREFLRACDQAGPDSKRAVRGTFRQAGDIVKVDAAERIRSYSARSAAGYRTVVRLRGVSVEQSLRKSENIGARRPNFGGLQLSRALYPAADEKEGEVAAAFEHALDTVADHFENT